MPREGGPSGFEELDEDHSTVVEPPALRKDLIHDLLLPGASEPTEQSDDMVTVSEPRGAEEKPLPKIVVPRNAQRKESVPSTPLPADKIPKVIRPRASGDRLVPKIDVSIEKGQIEPQPVISPPSSDGHEGARFRRSRAKPAEAPPGYRPVERPPEKKYIAVFNDPPVVEKKSEFEIIAEKRAEKLRKLWPEGVRSPFKQGPIGDCYALAALDCIKNLPDGESKLLDMVEEVSPGHWRVRFFDPDAIVPRTVGPIESGVWTWIDMNEAEVQRGENTILRQGSFGDRLIERAFLRFIQINRGGKSGETLKHEKGEARLLVEGGVPHSTLYYFVGREYEKNVVTSPEDRYSVIGSIAADQYAQNGMMAIASSKKEFATPGWKDRLKMFTQNILGHTPVIIVPNHAYRISHVDLKRQRVELVNPHDTSVRENIPIEEFMEKFFRISVVQKAAEASMRNDFTNQFPVQK